MNGKFNLKQSLRGILICSLLLAGSIPVLLLNLMVLLTAEQTVIGYRKIDVQQHSNMIGTELGAFSRLQDALTDEMINTLNWYSEAYDGRILLVDSSYTIVLDTYSADLGKVCVSDAVFAAFSGKSYESYDSNDGYITIVQPVFYAEGTDRKTTSVLIVSASTSWIRDALERTRLGMVLMDIILFAILLAASIYGSYLILRPFEQAAKEVEKISEGNLNRDMESIRSYHEIDRIMSSASHVIRRYQELDQSQEEFVSNVSHELRTPMTSIRVLSDSLIGQEGLDEEIYQEFLTDISKEVDRESRIIDDLLSMIRLGHAADSMNISTVNINEFTMDIMKSVRPIAKTRRIEMIYESFRQISADVDEMKLKQAFSNLIENAVKYNNDDGYVKVSLDADHAYFYLKVEDNGVGIPEDALDSVFDRFYRVDKARSRDTGGTGLGLSIAKNIVLLHYGTIKCESVLGQGTTFTVRIPLKHVKGGI